MYTMSLRFEADIYCLLHTWYYSIESEIEDLDNSGFDEVTNYEKREKPRSKCDPSGRRI